MRLARVFALTLSVLFLVSSASQAQNKPVLCLDTCEPDPASGSYAATYATRPQSKNGRAGGSIISRPMTTDGPASALPGSESYGYAIPILSLPGRNGLDVNLMLFYNSAVWTIDVAGGTATFNADRDYPSYGFHLGYGLIEAPPSGQTSYLLTEGDGTKRELRFSSGTTYVTVDSSYIDWNSSTKVLRRKDGTQWTYQQVPSATTFNRPIKILDTNGNYISIVYSTATGADKQAIATITDTVNRVITFIYDTSSTPRLQSITVTPPGGTAKTVAYFSWTATTLNYSFSLTVRDSLATASPITVLTSCAYPNAAGTGSGISYAFTYGDWGIVNKISRKSASGTVRSYVRYDYPAATSALSDHPAYQHQFVSADGTSENSWTYAVTKTDGVTSSLAVTNPANTTTTTNLYTSSWNTGLVSAATISSGSTTYRTLSNSWTQDNTSQSTPLNPRVLSTGTTLGDSGQTAGASFTYDSNGNVTDVYENDYGTAAIRRTHTDYLTGTAYSNLHILDRPSAAYVSDGSNNLKSQSAYTYDSYGSGPTTVTGAPQHDDTNYGAGFTTRGNVTKTTRYKTPSLTAPSGPIDRTLTYDTLGNLLTAQVDCCQQKTWAFSAITKYAYPDSLTRGNTTPPLQSSATYDLGTGLVLTQTDENSQVLHYGYDALNRPTSITGPLSLSVTLSYDDNSAQPSVSRTVATDSAKSTVQITTADGLSRVIKQQTQDAAGQNASIVETQYDSSGRVAQVSNPHASGASPVWTVNQFDGLDRVVKVIPTDGSQTANNTQFLYSGNAAIVTDPAGKQRRSFSDALGRLVQVDEPGAGNATTSQASVTVNGTEQSMCDPQVPLPDCSLIYDSGTLRVTVNSFQVSASYGQSSTANSIASALRSQLNGTGSPVTASASGGTISLTSRVTGSSTNYSISASSSNNDPTNFPSPSFYPIVSGPTMTGGTDGSTLDNPSLQHPQTTTYAYNVLNDLTNSTQGQQQRSFVYDALGRLTSATTPETGAATYTYSDYGLVLSRTDARNVAAAYQYDSLNRLTGIGYTLSGSAWSVMPNVCTPSGGSAANVCLAYGTSVTSFNNGRPTQMTDPSGSEAYQYNALGRVTTLTKTVGSTAFPISYAYDIIGNLKTITYPSGRIVQQSLDSLERVTQISSSGTNYVSSLAYNSAWQPTGFSYGNGVAASFGYNSRMQLASLAYAKSGSTLFSLNYDYATGVPGNNGQIQKITDNVDTTRTSTMVYDAWLRLKSWTNSQATVTETYDRYGNRLTQSLPVPSTVAVDATTNHITTTGYAYDAAGNMTNDSINALAYDGENRVITSTQSGATYTYSYDGNGLRVKKTPPTGSATVYLFSGSKVIAEYASGAAPGSPSKEYIYSGSQLIATLAGSATTYHHQDHLSVRVSTDATGTVLGQQGHYPFGETWYETGAASKWKFTSYERDSESSNDYAMARAYANRLARFSSPDPIPGSLGDPQSLNRYAYSLNDPANLTDPLGLCSPGMICVTSWGSPWPSGPGIGGGSGGSPKTPELSGPDDGGGNSLTKNFLNLDICIKNNAKNFSIGGVINLAANQDVPGTGLLDNQVTSIALAITGQAGLLDTASAGGGLGKDAFKTLNKPIMTNGPNSLTSLTAQRGSPQPVLGNGTNHNLSFGGKVLKVGATLKGIADVALSGALVADCLLGQVK